MLILLSSYSIEYFRGYKNISITLGSFCTPSMDPLPEEALRKVGARYVPNVFLMSKYAIFLNNVNTDCSKLFHIIYIYIVRI